MFPIPYFTARLKDGTIYTPERFVTMYYGITKTKGVARKTCHNLLIFFSLLSDVAGCLDVQEPLYQISEKYIALIVLTIFLDDARKHQDVMIKEMILPFLLTFDFTYKVEAPRSLIVYEQDIATFCILTEDLLKSEFIRKNYENRTCIAGEKGDNQKPSTLNQIIIFCRNESQVKCGEELLKYAAENCERITKLFNSVKCTSEGIVFPGPYKPDNVCKRYK